jgi:acyl-CoA-binding protein
MLQGYFYCIYIFVCKKKVLSDEKLNLYAIYDRGFEGNGDRVRVVIFMLKREEILEGWINLKKVEFQNL